jgi:hypothetical protein
MSAGACFVSLGDAVQGVTRCSLVAMSSSPLEEVSLSSLGQSLSSGPFASSSRPFALLALPSNRRRGRFNGRVVGRASSSSAEASSSLPIARSSVRADRKPVRAAGKPVETDGKFHRASSTTENVNGRGRPDAGKPQPASRSSFAAARTTVPACPTPERASLTAGEASSPPFRFDRWPCPSNRRERRTCPSKHRAAVRDAPAHRLSYPSGRRVFRLAGSVPSFPPLAAGASGAILTGA